MSLCRLVSAYVVQVFIRLFVPFENMDRSGVASISGRTQHGGPKLSQSSRSLTGRLIDELFEQEFRTHFLHPRLNFNLIVR